MNTFFRKSFGGQTQNGRNLIGMAQTNNQERKIVENRRKVSEAMTMLMLSEDFKQTSQGGQTGADSQFNSFLNNSVPADRTMKPRVLALSSRRMRMGDLSAAKTKFQLTASPRVNCIQAALFSDKNQQLQSPMSLAFKNGSSTAQTDYSATAMFMLQKRMNSGVYNEATAAKMGVSFVSDGHQT